MLKNANLNVKKKNMSQFSNLQVFSFLSSSFMFMLCLFIFFKIIS